MAITFGGLATGLDTNALIDGLMQAEAIPLNRNRAEQASLTSAKDTLSSFLNKVSAVKTAAQSLDTESEVASFSATSSGDGVVPTVTGTALSGTYSVQVNALAKESRTKSQAFADSTAALGQAGTLDITVGGLSTVNVTVAAGDSLADIAANINQSDARVSASVIYDGTNSTLVVQGQDTGAANAVTFGETGSVDLQLDVPANTYQAASDASITLDNQFTITRGTNKFQDVIPGVTLVPTQVTTGAVDIKVESDVDAQAEKIQTLIDAFNESISAGHLAAGFGSVRASNQNLSGDSAIRTALDRLTSTVSTPVSGLSGKYNMLAAIGVNLTQDGSLELDRSKLQQALDDDPEAVTKIFVGDADAGIKGVMESLIETVDALADGDDSVLEVRVDAFDSRITRLEEDELSLLRRLDDFEARLRKKFTDMELLVSSINEQGSALAGFVGLTPSNNNASS